MYLDLVVVRPRHRSPAIPPRSHRPSSPKARTCSYAGQWLIFAVRVAIGWMFAVRRSIRTRRAPPGTHGDTVTDESDGPAAVGFPVPTADEADHDDALNSSRHHLRRLGRRRRRSAGRPTTSRSAGRRTRRRIGDAVAVEPHQRLETEVVEDARPALSGGHTASQTTDGSIAPTAFEHCRDRVDHPGDRAERRRRSSIPSPDGCSQPPHRTRPPADPAAGSGPPIGIRTNSVRSGIGQQLVGVPPEPRGEPSRAAPPVPPPVAPPAPSPRPTSRRRPAASRRTKSTPARPDRRRSIGASRRRRPGGDPSASACRGRRRAGRRAPRPRRSATPVALRSTTAPTPGESRRPARPRRSRGAPRVPAPRASTTRW